MVKEDIPFRREERSYFSTPTRCRLATFEEAKNNLEIIKELNLLEKWDRVRLLDGWILGPGYGFQMGNDFKGCLGYMLLIETDASGFPYADVNLSPLGKDVALFLCVDDWNYEVVYWLLNSWSNSEIMNLGDVRGGNIPFSNAAEFVERNEMLSSVARKLGEEGGAAREKEGKAKYSGKDSVKELLSGMIKILTKEKDIVGFIGDGIWHFRSYEGDEYHLPPSVETGDVAETLWSSVCEAGDVADAYWSFVCETFAGYAVEVCALTSLLYIRRKMKTKRTSEKNLMIATSILLYLSDYQSDIILEPLHSFSGSCAGKILSHAAKEAVGDPHCLREKLKGNAMWRCYDETGNYGILDKLLFIADVEQADENVKGMLLQCGAQRRQQSMHIRGREKAAKFKDEDLHTEIGRALLRRCDKEGRNHFVNARDERGRTALHRASQRMNSTLCKLLIEFGASVNAQDQNDMTPLHCALEVGPYALEGEGIGRISEVGKAMNVLMESPHATESLHLKDVRERTPLDIAAAKNDNPLTAKLLSKFEEPEAYFDKVDEKQLLRNSLLLGSVDIVHKLLEKGITLPAGDCDNDRKTVLHLAAMCDNESSALEIIQFLGNMEDMVAKQDRKGRTALHEAALKGHLKVCKLLLGKNPELIYKKDRDGRNPLYDAVKAEDNRTDLHESLFAVYLEKVKFQKDLVDRRGVTPLHVAASEGKAKVVGKLLFEYKVKENYLSRGDFMGQTALHKAVKRGDVDMVKILLKHGAHPLRERDNDGRTALHYAVQAETGDKHKMVDMLLNKCASDQEKSLLLWASAAGLGTADQNLREDDSLRIFLADKKREMQGSTGY